MKRLAPILFISTWLLAACSFSLAEDITPPPGSEQMPPVSTQSATISGPLYPLVPPDPENGALIFAEKCAPCHGDRGQGDGSRAAQLPNPAAPLGSAEIARQASPAEWYTMVTKGDLERFMPPFNSLSDRERWDVVAYAFLLSTPSAVLDEGQALYLENCATCHGEGGAGDGPQAASLTSGPPVLTDQSILSQKSAENLFQSIADGISPEMPGFAGQLNEDQLWSLSAYLRTLTFSAAGQPPALEETPLTGSTGSTTETLEPEPAAAATAIAEAPQAEAPAGIGLVKGTVINASGEALPADLTVNLNGFDDMQPVITQSTELYPDGSFLFTSVEMPVGRVFMVTVDYQGTSYGSDIAVAEAGNLEFVLPVTVYETTTDTGILSIDRLHMFFEFVDENTLQVIELYIMSNPTNRTLVAAGEGQPSVRFKLPAGATNLEFQDGILGERFIQTADGFGDTASIRPGAGTYELLFAFEMPYNRSLELVQPISFPVEAVVILVPETGLKVKSEALTDGGLRDVQGMQYRLYNGSRLAAGENLEISLSGRPVAQSPGLLASNRTNIVIGLGVFGVALILSGAWFYRRSRKVEQKLETSPLTEASGEAEPVDDSKDSLMDAIIALDDLYQEGQLPEEAYLLRRAELKARLTELMDSTSDKE